MTNRSISARSVLPSAVCHPDRRVGVLCRLGVEGPWQVCLRHSHRRNHLNCIGRQLTPILPPLLHSVHSPYNFRTTRLFLYSLSPLSITRRTTKTGGYGGICAMTNRSISGIHPSDLILPLFSLVGRSFNSDIKSLRRCLLSRAGRCTSETSSLRSSIKVEVKKKHLSNGWPFPCFAAHLIEQDLFGSAAP